MPSESVEHVHIVAFTEKNHYLLTERALNILDDCTFSMQLIVLNALLFHLFWHFWAEADGHTHMQTNTLMDSLGNVVSLEDSIGTCHSGVEMCIV